MDRRVVTFGEIMGRIDFPNYTKIYQGLPGEVHLSFAGSEANVAVSISHLGGRSRFVTSLPDNDIANACIGKLKGLGVDTDYIIHGPGRLGLYFAETGTNQRPGKIIYDRDNSSVSLTEFSAYQWPEIFSGGSWLHISGITPALSRQSYSNSAELCRVAKQAGLTVSCDINFRKKLWNWEPGVEPRTLARQCMPEILQHTDIILANEEDSSDVLDIHAENSNVTGGNISITDYEWVTRQIAERFPNVQKVAITLRESISASHNNWGAMLFNVANGQIRLAPLNSNGQYQPYSICNIVDRIGVGDSFAAGLIFALNSGEYSDNDALRFAVAASCLCHSIHGDFNLSTRNEVEALTRGDTLGRVQR